MAIKPAKKAADEVVTVRVLCAVVIGGTDYRPNDVIEGLPADLFAQFSGSLDDHPNAIQDALSGGGKKRTFKA